MGDGGQYKKNAEEWRAMARKMRRAKDRAKLERMGDDWEQLALDTERKRKEEG
jgi:hypothetical protein